MIISNFFRLNSQRKLVDASIVIVVSNFCPMHFRWKQTKVETKTLHSCYWSLVYNLTARQIAPKKKRNSEFVCFPSWFSALTLTVCWAFYAAAFEFSLSWSGEKWKLSRQTQQLMWIGLEYEIQLRHSQRNSVYLILMKIEISCREHHYSVFVSTVKCQTKLKDRRWYWFLFFSSRPGFSLAYLCTNKIKSICMQIASLNRSSVPLVHVASNHLSSELFTRRNFDNSTAAIAGGSSVFKLDDKIMSFEFFQPNTSHNP